MYLHFFSLLLYVCRCSCLLVSILSDCNSIGWMRQTRAKNARLERKLSFFFLFFFLFCFIASMMHNEKRTRKENLWNLLYERCSSSSSLKAKKESDVIVCVYVCGMFICFWSISTIIIITIAIINKTFTVLSKFFFLTTIDIKEKKSQNLALDDLRCCQMNERRVGYFSLSFFLLLLLLLFLSLDCRHKHYWEKIGHGNMGCFLFLSSKRARVR